MQWQWQGESCNISLTAMLKVTCFQDPALGSMASPSLSTEIIWKQLSYDMISCQLGKALRKSHRPPHSEMLLCHFQGRFMTLKLGEPSK